MYAIIQAVIKKVIKFCLFSRSIRAFTFSLNKKSLTLLIFFALVVGLAGLFDFDYCHLRQFDDGCVRSAQHFDAKGWFCLHINMCTVCTAHISLCIMITSGMITVIVCSIRMTFGIDRNTFAVRGCMHSINGGGSAMWTFSPNDKKSKNKMGSSSKGWQRWW